MKNENVFTMDALNQLPEQSLSAINKYNMAETLAKMMMLLETTNITVIDPDKHMYYIDGGHCSVQTNLSRSKVTYKFDNVLLPSTKNTLLNADMGYHPEIIVKISNLLYLTNSSIFNRDLEMKILNTIDIILDKPNDICYTELTLNVPYDYIRVNGEFIGWKTNKGHVVKHVCNPDGSKSIRIYRDGEDVTDVAPKSFDFLLTELSMISPVTTMFDHTRVEHKTWDFLQLVKHGNIESLNQSKLRKIKFNEGYYEISSYDDVFVLRNLTQDKVIIKEKNDMTEDFKDALEELICY